MDRSLWAVMAGTFTLRFSTGLTGAMLAVYLGKLPEHGGDEVSATTVGLLAAAFFASELVLSPFFGVLSDRIGHHRVMLFGPAFGAVAVILTGLTTNIPLLGATRVLEGASTAASVPSILGYIALATAMSEVLRGKAAARFEGATLAGIGAGIAVAPLLFAALGPTAFFLNALVYGVSFLVYQFGVADRDAEERRAAAVTRKTDETSGWARYRSIVGNEYVLLLAPTWIAVNASIGLWFSQSLFQFSKSEPRFPEQYLHKGFSPIEITLAVIAIGVVFAAGLIWWGNRFKSIRRTTIIFYGILGGGVMALGILAVNHAMRDHILIAAAGVLVAAVGLFVLAGATPAALGLLADISERFPTDRGAIMGLYSVFLAIGQITGSLIGGAAATWRGIDGLLIATVVLLLLALVPLWFLRKQEPEVSDPAAVTHFGAEPAHE